jgi:ABC-type phosphate transport system auxiliary subunit
MLATAKAGAFWSVWATAGSVKISAATIERRLVLIGLKGQSFQQNAQAFDDAI